MTQISSQYLNIDAQLNRVIERIVSTELLNNIGLSNDIGFHIFDYLPEHEDKVRNFIETALEPALRKHSQKIRFINVNLFQTVIDLLKERDLLERSLEMQRSKGNEALQKAIYPILKEDKLAQFLINSLNLDELDLVLLTGVGAAYPLVRLHSLLNGLHPLMKDTPLVVFYPGRYDGRNLRLFGLNSERNDANAPYYRAFQLLK